MPIPAAHFQQQSVVRMLREREVVPAPCGVGARGTLPGEAGHGCRYRLQMLPQVAQELRDLSQPSSRGGPGYGLSGGLARDAWFLGGQTLGLF